VTQFGLSNYFSVDIWLFTIRSYCWDHDSYKCLQTCCKQHG